MDYSWEAIKEQLRKASVEAARMPQDRLPVWPKPDDHDDPYFHGLGSVWSGESPPRP